MAKHVFDKLYKAYGPQGWWPIHTRSNTHGFDDRGYHKRSRPKLTEQDRWEIILGAILTQNTSWKNVEHTLDNLKSEGVLHKLDTISVGKIATLIKSSGYYNQKAKKIKAMIKFLKSGKEITRENLLDIWGVGPETADSILLYAFNKPCFVVDLYTKRIFSRLGSVEGESYQAFQDYFHNNLKRDSRLFNEFHALLVEHAKQHCRSKPVCEGCPLLKSCRQGKTFIKS